MPWAPEGVAEAVTAATLALLEALPGARVAEKEGRVGRGVELLLPPVCVGSKEALC